MPTKLALVDLKLLGLRRKLYDSSQPKKTPQITIVVHISNMHNRAWLCVRAKIDDDYLVVATNANCMSNADLIA